MHIGKRVALGGAVLAFLSMPATAMGAKKKAKITVKSVAAVPIQRRPGRRVRAGRQGQVRAKRSASPPPGACACSTSARSRNKGAPRLGTFEIKRLKANRTRSFSERVVAAPP